MGFLLTLRVRARSRRPRSSGGASLAPSTALTVAVTRPAGPFRAPGTFRTTRTARSFGTVTGTRATGSKRLPRAVGAARFARTLRTLRTGTRASGTVPSTATRSRSGGTRGLTVAVRPRREVGPLVDEMRTTLVARAATGNVEFLAAPVGHDRAPTLRVAGAAEFAREAARERSLPGVDRARGSLGAGAARGALSFAP